MPKMTQQERMQRRNERLADWATDVQRFLVACTPIGRKDACWAAIATALDAFNARLRAEPLTDTEAYKRRVLAALEPVRRAYVPGEASLAALLRAQRQEDRAFARLVAVPSRQAMLTASLAQLRATTAPRDEEAR